METLGAGAEDIDGLSAYPGKDGYADSHSNWRSLMTLPLSVFINSSKLSLAPGARQRTASGLA